MGKLIGQRTKQDVLQSLDEEIKKARCRAESNRDKFGWKDEATHNAFRFLNNLEVAYETVADCKTFEDWNKEHPKYPNMEKVGEIKGELWAAKDQTERPTSEQETQHEG